MTNQLSHIHSVLTINGSRVQGLSDDDVPVELPDIDISEAKFGKDGTMYTIGSGMKGGEVIIRLLPTSVTASDWLREHARIQTGEVVKWDGVWSDSNLGYSTLMRGGVLKKAPPGIHPGKNCEFTFTFEQLIPQFDGASFDPAPIFS